jgi:hypothetical protein
MNVNSWSRETGEKETKRRAQFWLSSEQNRGRKNLNSRQIAVSLGNGSRRKER